MTTIFRLADLLDRHGISQSELARISGVSLATVGRLCRNDTAQVSLATLDKLADALGVDPSELIGREKKPRR